MIFVLICVAIALIGFVMMKKTDYCETANTVGITMFVYGLFVLIILAIFIFFAHVGVSVKITQNNITYESLCRRKEIIESHYEDVSKSDIIKDIAEWNRNVKDIQYWTYNPWTSWFYSREVADNLKTIEMDSDSVVR